MVYSQDVQLIEFLDDDEILQEYKSQNKNLVQLLVNTFDSSFYPSLHYNWRTIS